jgi:hypothetical protein
MTETEKKEKDILAAAPGTSYDLTMYYEGRERFFGGEKEIDLTPIKELMTKGFIRGFMVTRRSGGHDEKVAACNVPSSGEE